MLNPKLLTAALMMAAAGLNGLDDLPRELRGQSPKPRNPQNPDDARAIAEAQAKRERKAAKRKGATN
jgi:hypothetical protein